MSLQYMDIDFCIGGPLWTLPSEPSRDELQYSLSDEFETPDSMELDNSLDEVESVREFTQNEYGIPNSLAGSGSSAVGEETIHMSDWPSVEFSTALPQGTLETTAFVSPVLPEITSALPETILQRTLKDVVPTMSAIVPQALQPQLLKDALSFIPEALPQPSQVTEPNRNYYYASQSMSNETVQGNHMEVPDMTNPQAVTNSLLFPGENSSIENINGLECPQQSASQVRVLESHSIEGFRYSKVWIKNPVLCPCCKEEYATTADLGEHTKRSHKDRNQPQCQCLQCGDMLMNKTNLTRHVNNVHKDGKNLYPCEICNAKFSSKSSATTHRRKVHGIQSVMPQRASGKKVSNFFRCETCDCYSKTKANMIRHVEGVHLKLRRFLCECGNAFKTKHNLDCHKSSKCCFV